MSGKKHHYIPQLLLRGFLSKHNRKTEKVWIFSKDKQPFFSTIEDVAVQRNFYSQTLDNDITDYEANQLSKLINSLRQIPINQVVDSFVAAEIVAHLTPRTTHIRNVLKYGMDKLLNTLSMTYSDPLYINELLGFNHSKPSLLFCEEFLKTMEENPAFHQIGLPEPVLLRITFAIAKENFNKNPEKHTQFFSSIFNNLTSSSNTMVRNAHNKALTKSIVPESHLQYLNTMLWSVEQSTTVIVILPDCITIGITADGQAHPFMIVPKEDLIAIVMPFSSTKLLIGRCNNKDIPELSMFNKNAASCCESFFVASKNIPEFEELRSFIGEKTTRIFDELVSDEILNHSTVTSHVDINKIIQGTSLFSEKQSNNTEFINSKSKNIKSKNLSLQLIFSGSFEMSIIDKITVIIEDILSEISQLITLDCLEGITFTDDYINALYELDRGYPNTKPLETSSNDIAVGIAMSPLIIRNGLIKTHLILRSNVGYDLLSNDQSVREFAIYIIIRQLMESAYIGLFDSTLPNILLKPIEHEYEGMLYQCIEPALTAYFSCRASAGFGRDDEIKEIYIKLLVLAIERAQRIIPEARLSYRFDKDLDKLLSVTWEFIKQILQFSSQILGHCDGINISPFDKEGIINSAFEKAGLRLWFNIYQNDLRILWDRRGQWSSIHEFLDLGCHVERIAWQYGIFPWYTGEVIRVEIPIESDITELTKKIVQDKG